MKKKSKHSQVRIEADVVSLLKKYGQKFPVKSTLPQLVNGLLRDRLSDVVQD